MNATRVACLLIIASVGCGGTSSANIVVGDGDAGGNGRDGSSLGLDAGGDGYVPTSADANGGCPNVGESVVDVPVPATPNGGRCGGVYAVNSSCDACVSQSCCEQESACGQKADCVADIQCTIACSSLDPGCPAACDQTHASGAGQLGDVRSCEQAKCASACAQLATLTFDCSVVCVDHGPPGTVPGVCSVVSPDGGADDTTLVACNFEPPPCGQ